MKKFSAPIQPDTFLSPKKRGDCGEDAVVRYLKRRGYRILARNYRVRGGEIDIIAATFRYIVFVEVKTRDKYTDCERFGHPADALTEEKKAHLLHAARRYLAEHYTTKKPRFDLAEVFLTVLPSSRRRQEEKRPEADRSRVPNDAADRSDRTPPEKSERAQKDKTMFSVRTKTEILYRKEAF